MTDNRSAAESAPYNPASMPTSSLSSTKMVWYKRPWFLLAVAVIVIVAVSVITDLPHPITLAQDASDQNGTLKLINADIAPCNYAVTQAFSFFQMNVKGQLTAAHMTVVKQYLTEDQVACSFAGGPISDLTQNIQVNDTTAGKKIDRMLSVVVTWITSDANGAIADIQQLISHPGDASKLADLSKRETLLASERLTALNDLHDAGTILGVTLDRLKLPTLPHLSGT